MLRTVFFMMILILLLASGCKQEACLDMIDTEYNGTVVNKELHKRYRTPYIYYTDEQGKEKLIRVTGYDHRLYKFIKVGDSIYKRQHTRDISIIREGRSYTYTLECGPNLTR